MADFAALVRPGETLYFLQADPVPPAAGFEVLVAAEAVQMVAQNVPAVAPDEAIVALDALAQVVRDTLSALHEPFPALAAQPVVA